jgi:5-methyltetrahydrofolate--homocysteine methyltransferase
MSYTPPQPNQPGIHVLPEIPLTTLISYIDWRFFFMAWRLTGNYTGLEEVCDCASCQTGWLQQFPQEQRDKAKEAMSLFKDARAMLKECSDKQLLKIQGTCGLFPAVSENEGITFTHEEKKIYIPTLRQQEYKKEGYYLSLADFISPVADYAGTFAVTVHGAEELSRNFDKEDDSYNSILIKTLADRLAEAAAEWLHEKIRKEYWGYDSKENLSIGDMLKVRYTGIRPAVGYPSLPDQSIIFDLQPILPFDKIGISLTENGAMYPNASVCGLVISHPKSQYFNIGKIDNAQLSDYAKRKGKSTDEVIKWLAHNLS